MLATALFCFVHVAAAAAAFGGPPLPHDQMPAGPTRVVAERPEPGREVLDVDEEPEDVLVNGLWHYYRTNPALAGLGPPAVSIDDLDRVDSLPQPPLEHSLPVFFRADGIVVVPEVPVVESPGQPAKGLTSWLPERVQSWLSHIPSPTSLIPSLPSYIPGVEFEAEVHRKPVTVPHVPTPGEIVKRAQSLMEKAIETLHRRQEQLIEIIKCSCPRPAKCESIMQEFLSFGGKPENHTSSPVPTSTEPSVSFFAGLTKPGGHGPGFGFFVDQSGPHLGHHIHNASAQASSMASSSATSSASAQASSSGASSTSSATASSSSSSMAGAAGAPISSL